jgi:hypothetical protein
MDWKPTKFPNGVSAAAGIQIGADGTQIAGLAVYTPTLSPAQVAADETAEQTFPVQGLSVGDIVLAVNKPTAQAGLGIVGVRVSAANTLAITFANVTAAPITPTPNEVYSVVGLTP